MNISRVTFCLHYAQESVQPYLIEFVSMLLEIIEKVTRFIGNSVQVFLSFSLKLKLTVSWNQQLAIA